MPVRGDDSDPWTSTCPPMLMLPFVPTLPPELTTVVPSLVLAVLTLPCRLMAPQPFPVAKMANVCATPYSRSSEPDTSTIAAVEGGTVPSDTICQVSMTLVPDTP